MSPLVPALLGGLAVLAAGLRTPSRLTPLRPPGAPVARAAPPRTARQRVLACAVAGLALALFLGGAAGPVLGLALGGLGPGLLAGLEPAADRAERRRLDSDLPSALDLLAACLAGGASLEAAARAVSTTVGGPAGARFEAVAARLQVGSPPVYAWQALAGEGPAGPDDDASAAARTLARASDGGAPVADAVVRLAADARTRARSRSEQAVARAGVLGVAPLGLCFLPAFVLVGIVPVVLGLIGPVLRGV